MKKIKMCIISLILLSASVRAYAQSEGSMAVVLKSTNGDISISKHPEKVIVLDFSALETFHELGISVAGVPHSIPEYLSEYRDRKYAKFGSLTKPDIDAIAAFKPDLIISGGRQGDYYDSLAMIAPTVIFPSDNANFWSNFETTVYSIGALYGKEDLANKKLAQLQNKIEQVRAKTQQDHGKALFVLHVKERFNPNGSHSRFGFGYDVLGLKAAFTAPASADGGAARRSRTPGDNQKVGIQNAERPAQPSPDQINPDYLFIIDRATAIQGQVPELSTLLTDEIKVTKAFKNNKVFVLPGAIWYLSGSGLISVDKKISDIGSMLYGIDF